MYLARFQAVKLTLLSDKIFVYIENDRSISSAAKIGCEECVKHTGPKAYIQLGGPLVLA
jgi:hypothetical protein